ncbi:hypothetical protein, partial [Nocardioides sp. GCM10030258]|uniref:hypothetical protein n=1 Tax=unclassified Nocardioides TaxID=2615069 RepID=UPI0036204311
TVVAVSWMRTGHGTNFRLQARTAAKVPLTVRPVNESGRRSRTAEVTLDVITDRAYGHIRPPGCSYWLSGRVITTAALAVSQ